MPKPDPDSYIRSRPPMFWWFLANVLAIAFAISSWVVCLNLFRDPIHPLSYEAMVWVGRVDPLQAFVGKEIPKEDRVLDPVDLDGIGRGFREEDLKVLNERARRGYLTNYEGKDWELSLLEGRFRVLGARSLGEEDFLWPGLIVRLQAEIKPQEDQPPVPYPVVAELLLPGPVNDPAAYPVGSEIILQRNPLRVAILDMRKLDDRGEARTGVTAVPLAAVSFVSPAGVKIEVLPPPKANPRASFPLFSK